MCKYLMHRSGFGLGLLSLLILAFLLATKPSPIPTRALEFPIRFDVLLSVEALLDELWLNPCFPRIRFEKHWFGWQSGICSHTLHPPPLPMRYGWWLKLLLSSRLRRLSSGSGGTAGTTSTTTITATTMPFWGLTFHHGKPQQVQTGNQKATLKTNGQSPGH